MFIQQLLKQLLALLNLHQHATNQLISSISPIFDHLHPKIIKEIFSFPELVPSYKNQFIPTIASSDTAK